MNPTQRTAVYKIDGKTYRVDAVVFDRRYLWKVLSPVLLRVVSILVVVLLIDAYYGLMPICLFFCLIEGHCGFTHCWLVLSACILYQHCRESGYFFRRGRVITVTEDHIGNVLEETEVMTF